MKRNILTIKQNTWGSRSGQGLISTPVLKTEHASDEYRLPTLLTRKVLL